MKKRFIKFLIVIVCTAVLLLAGAVIYYYIKWRPLWQCEEPLPVYQVMQHHDDTLRVIFVGDSWVGMRQATADSSLQMRLATQTGLPVKICSSGRDEPVTVEPACPEPKRAIAKQILPKVVMEEQQAPEDA